MAALLYGGGGIGGGASYECKTEITSEREMSKVLATALFDKGAGPLIKRKF